MSAAGVEVGAKQCPAGIVEHVERRPRARVHLDEDRGVAGEQEVEADEADEPERGAHRLGGVAHARVDRGRQVHGANGAAVAKGARALTDGPLAADADDAHAVACRHGEHRMRHAVDPPLKVAARAALCRGSVDDMRAAAAADALRQPAAGVGGRRQLRRGMGDAEGVEQREKPGGILGAGDGLGAVADQAIAA